MGLFDAHPATSDSSRVIVDFYFSGDELPEDISSPTFAQDGFVVGPVQPFGEYETGSAHINPTSIGGGGVLDEGAIIGEALSPCDVNPAAGARAIGLTRHVPNKELAGVFSIGAPAVPRCLIILEGGIFKFRPSVACHKKAATIARSRVIGNLRGGVGQRRSVPIWVSERKAPIPISSQRPSLGKPILGGSV